MRYLFDELNREVISIKRLKEFEPKEGYYLAFSGGKDSQVLYALAQRSEVKFTAYYCVTTCDPPEITRFIKNNYPDVKMEKPALSMWELIPKKLMPPTRIVRYCCEHLKEYGGEGRVVLTGIRSEESYARQSQEVYNKRKNKIIVNPIIDWNECHVWTFIEENNIDVCSLYDEMDRIGCVGCPMQGEKGQARDFKKWPTYRKKYIKAFEAMLQERARKKLKTSWKTGEDVMNWWLKVDKKPK